MISTSLMAGCKIFSEMSLPTYSADAMHSVDHYNVARQLQEESQKDEMAKVLFMFLQQGKVA